MSVIHISQFYSCSRIKNAGELYYVCELGKYLYEYFDDVLSLDGVLFDDVLKQSHLWDILRIALKRGYITNTGLSEEDTEISIQSPLIATKDNFANVLLTTDEVRFDAKEDKRRKEDKDYNLYTPIRKQISFQMQKPESWVWSMKGKDGKFGTQNNLSMNNPLARQMWLSLVAMVAVFRLRQQEPETLVILVDRQTVIDKFAFAYVIALLDKTEALKDWVFLSFDEKMTKPDILQLYYCSWYQEGRDLGLTRIWHGKDDKIGYMQELDIQVGDLIFVYERNAEQNNNYVKSISSCRLAVIKDIVNEYIDIEYINTIKTKLQGEVDWNDKTTNIKAMYNFRNPANDFSTSKERLDFYSIGVGHMLYNELKFILPLDDADEQIVQWVTDGIHKDRLLLSQNDLIYWVLKDYNYQFNELRFLDRYFPTKTPLYTRYMNGEDLSAYKVV